MVGVVDVDVGVVLVLVGVVVVPIGDKIGLVVLVHK